MRGKNILYWLLQFSIYFRLFITLIHYFHFTVDPMRSLLQIWSRFSVPPPFYLHHIPIVPSKVESLEVEKRDVIIVRLDRTRSSLCKIKKWDIGKQSPFSEPPSNCDWTSIFYFIGPRDNWTVRSLNCTSLFCIC